MNNALNTIKIDALNNGDRAFGNINNVAIECRVRKLATGVVSSKWFANGRKVSLETLEGMVSSREALKAEWAAVKAATRAKWEARKNA